MCGRRVSVGFYLRLFAFLLASFYPQMNLLGARRARPDCKTESKNLAEPDQIKFRKIFYVEDFEDAGKMEEELSEAKALMKELKDGGVMTEDVWGKRFEVRRLSEIENRLLFKSLHFLRFRIKRAQALIRRHEAPSNQNADEASKTIQADFKMAQELVSLLHSAHFPLVFFLTDKQYSSILKNFAKAELGIVEVGSHALLKVIERYDYRMNFTFGSYAGAVLRNCFIELNQKVIEQGGKTVSLDLLNSTLDDNKRAFVMTEDTKTEGALDLVKRTELIEVVREAVKTMTEEQAKIISHLYGLDPYEKLNHIEISKRLGIRASRVKAIQQRIERLLAEKLQGYWGAGTSVEIKSNADKPAVSAQQPQREKMAEPQHVSDSKVNDFAIKLDLRLTPKLKRQVEIYLQYEQTQGSFRERIFKLSDRFKIEPYKIKVAVEEIQTLLKKKIPQVKIDPTKVETQLLEAIANSRLPLSDRQLDLMKMYYEFDGTHQRRLRLIAPKLKMELKVLQREIDLIMDVFQQNKP